MRGEFAAHPFLDLLGRFVIFFFLFGFQQNQVQRWDADTFSRFLAVKGKRSADLFPKIVFAFTMRYVVNGVGWFLLVAHFSFLSVFQRCKPFALFHVIETGTGQNGALHRNLFRGWNDALHQRKFRYCKPRELFQNHSR